MYDLEWGANLNIADFSTITREDGKKQVTFKGWPLYYFSPSSDGILEAPGETLGDGKNDAFFIAKPDYSVMLGKQVVVEGEEAVLYLVNDQGVSLYFSTGGDENISNCNGGCADVWPPFVASKYLIIPSFLSSEKFSFTERNDELGPQLSLFGSPLYKFTPDDGIRGNTLGGGPNANFFVMDPR